MLSHMGECSDNCAYRVIPQAAVTSPIIQKALVLILTIHHRCPSKVFWPTSGHTDHLEPAGSNWQTFSQMLMDVPALLGSGSLDSSFL